MSEKTTRVKSLTNPKVGGKYRLPGTVWDCPTELLDELLEAGAVVLYPRHPDNDKQQSLPPVSSLNKAAIIAELAERLPGFDRGFEASSSTKAELAELLLAIRDKQDK